MEYYASIKGMNCWYDNMDESQKQVLSEKQNKQNETTKNR